MPKRIYKCSICGSTVHNSLRHFEKTSKICKKCGRELNITDFTTKGVSHQGTYKYRSSICKDCNRDKRKILYHKDIHTRLMFLLGAVRQRVRIGGLAFNIDVKWLEELYAEQEGLCYYSGLPMSLDTGDTAISIDRRNSSGGYTKDNVVFTCWLVNNMKNGLDDESFVNLCKTITRYSRGVR